MYAEADLGNPVRKHNRWSCNESESPGSNPEALGYFRRQGV